MKRTIDSLGRLAIPKPIREEMGMGIGCQLEFVPDRENGVLLLKKEKNVCLNCGGKKNLLPLKGGGFLCKECLPKEI